MTTLTTHAAWVLVGAFGISIVYELWRATAKAGVSKHDSMRVFIREGLWYYIVAAIVIGLLFAGFAWAPWVALAFVVIAILVGVFYYNPTIMVAREPGLIDWIEDLVFMGLLFVAATLLLYEALGKSLVP